jgi:L-threonylcarbamoyladenylate synthase
VSGSRVPVDISCPGGEALERASSVLLSGGVVVYPSDTVYGLLCRADDRDAVAGIRSLKGYADERPFILLVSGMETVRALAGELTPPALEAAGRFWPGPVTLVLPAGPACPSWVTSSDGHIALRQPDHRLSTEILERVGVPLVSTSANTAGGQEALSPDVIPSLILDSAGLVLDGGKLPASMPSAVLRPSRDGIEVIRPGSGWPG